ncbi:MAG: hypothetical protein ABFS39_18055 [Pseudomonadota bacterium]
MELSAEVAQTPLINVCDREADFFELFDEQHQSPCLHPSQQQSVGWQATDKPPGYNWTGTNIASASYNTSKIILDQPLVCFARFGAALQPG